MINKYKNGFTFAELMISLVVIAVITVILMPIVANLNPNYNKQLFKSTYRTIEMTIADIIDSGNFYTAGSTDCTTGSQNSNGELPSTAQGLCTEFRCRLNVQSVKTDTSGSRVTWTDCTNTNDPGFVSNNGVRWRFNYTAATATTPAQHSILVDVNPNNNTAANIISGCFADNYGMASGQGFMCTADDITNDTFEIKVGIDGRITELNPAVAQNHLEGRSAD